MKWILIIWIITAEMPLGGPWTYGSWHDSYKECYEFAKDNKFDVITKLFTQFGDGFGIKLNDMNCVDTEWFKSNIIDPGFTVPKITGDKPRLGLEL